MNLTNADGVVAPEPRPYVGPKPSPDYLLVPMNQDGVEVRPIEQVDGAAEFNEVSFTAVPRRAWWTGRPWRSTGAAP